MGTSTTASLQTDSVATLAMLAVLEHAADHKLACWRVEHLYPGDQHGIRVGVSERHLDAWLDTLTVTSGPTVVKLPSIGGLELVEHTAVLSSAIGDVTVTICSSQRAPRLQAVTTEVSA